MPPSYEQRAFDPLGRRGRWQLVATPDGRDGSLTVHQDVRVWLADLEANRPLEVALSLASIPVMC